MTVNHIYSLNTIAPSVLGASFKNMRLVKNVGFEDAIVDDTTIVNKNSLVFKALAQTPIPDPSLFEYYVFEDVNKVRVVLALDWIDQNSIVEENVISTFRIDFYGLTVTESQLLVQRIRDLGFKNFTSISV